MKSLKFFPYLVTFFVISYLGADSASWDASDPSLDPSLDHGWDTDGSRSKGKTKKSQKDLFSLDVGAVYLKAYQGGTDFAEIINIADIGSNGDEPYGKNKGLDFDYDWGVRGAIGYEMGKSRQTAKATYLYYATDASRSAKSDFAGDLLTASQAVFSPIFGIPDSIGSLFTSTHSKWNLHFNMLDVTFGKKYPKKKCMTFEPFIGLKGIILSETQKSSYTTQSAVILTPQVAHIKQKTDFKGGGAVAGFNLNWSLSKWISFFGSIDAALLYSSIETKRSSDNVVSTILWIGRSTDVKGTPVLEGTFALRWVYCFKKGQFIDLKIGFEEHYIFQTMKHALMNPDSSTNLDLMGWFATLGVGF